MKALLFIQKFKELLRDVEESGGNPIFRVTLDHHLMLQLKSYTLEKLQSIDTNKHNELGQFIDDLLSRDIFATRIRYCIVKFQEFSLPNTEYFEYISAAIDLNLENPRYYDIGDSGATTKDRLVGEVAKCFKNWYRPEDLFLYDFSQERQLIFPNNSGQDWLISNLGRYFAELSSFEAVTFLCALEIALTLELHENSFISIDALKHLLNSETDESNLDPHLIRPYSLRMFGILKGHYRDPRVSDFGYKVLSYVDRNFEELKEQIFILLELEATGLSYKPDTNLDNLKQAAEKSEILLDDQIDSINKAIELYRLGAELDALRIIYPLIEGTLDVAIQSHNIPSSGLNGMRNKIDKLAKEGVISPEMCVTGEIISSTRNKIIHGNVLRRDKEFFRPIFAISAEYFQRLLLQLAPVSIHSTSTQLS